MLHAMSAFTWTPRARWIASPGQTCQWKLFEHQLTKPIMKMVCFSTWWSWQSISGAAWAVGSPSVHCPRRWVWYILACTTPLSAGHGHFVGPTYHASYGRQPYRAFWFGIARPNWCCSDKIVHSRLQLHSGHNQTSHFLQHCNCHVQQDMLTRGDIFCTPQHHRQLASSQAGTHRSQIFPSIQYHKEWASSSHVLE